MFTHVQLSYKMIVGKRQIRGSG